MENYNSIDSLHMDSIQYGASSSIRNENVLYTDFINYSLRIKNGDGTLLVDHNKQTTPISDCTPTPHSDTFWDDYYTFPPEGLSSHRYGEEKNFDALDDGLAMGAMATGEDNCGPTAITDVVRLYSKYELNNHQPLPLLLLGSDDKKTYNRLVELSGYGIVESRLN